MEKGRENVRRRMRNPKRQQKKRLQFWDGWIQKISILPQAQGAPSLSLFYFYVKIHFCPSQFLHDPV